jgi:hypothetical protein
MSGAWLLLFTLSIGLLFGVVGLLFHDWWMGVKR